MAPEAEQHPRLTQTPKDSDDVGYRLKAGIFLAASAGIGLFAGFGGALARAKKSGNDIGVSFVRKNSTNSTAHT